MWQDRVQAELRCPGSGFSSAPKHWKKVSELKSLGCFGNRMGLVCALLLLRVPRCTSGVQQRSQQIWPEVSCTHSAATCLVYALGTPDSSFGPVGRKPTMERDKMIDSERPGVHIKIYFANNNKMEMI